ncbi:MAG: outer membrane protein transport protein [Betaproteobacteria bacterium]|nr:outer membrane protein transport protein [Betaproteobacteria bacterium]
MDYQYSKELTLRGGFSYSDNPIKGQDVTFNILAPGVIRNHLSLGFTYKTQSGGELTMAYTHAFSNSVTAPSLLNSFTGPLPAGSETIKMYQNTIGIA